LAIISFDKEARPTEGESGLNPSESSLHYHTDAREHGRDADEEAHCDRNDAKNRHHAPTSSSG
jgi:hypothetical protein